MNFFFDEEEPGKVSNEQPPPKSPPTNKVDLIDLGEDSQGEQKI